MIHTFKDDGRPFLARLVRAGSFFDPLQTAASALAQPAALDSVELYLQDDARALLGTLLCRFPVCAVVDSDERYGMVVELATSRGALRMYGYQWRDDILPALGVTIPADPPAPPVPPAPEAAPEAAPTPSSKVDEAPF